MKRHAKGGWLRYVPAGATLLVILAWAAPAPCQQPPQATVIYSGQDAYGTLTIVQRTDAQNNVLRKTATFTSATTPGGATLVWDEQYGTNNLGTLMVPGGEVTTQYNADENTGTVTVSPNTGPGYSAVYSLDDGSLIGSEGDARAAGTAVFGTSPQLWSDYSNFLETEGIEEQASSGNPGPFMWAGTRCNTATAATLLDVSIAAGDLAACNLGDVIRCDKFATFDYYAVTNAYVNELFVCATFG